MLRFLTALAVTAGCAFAAPAGAAACTSVEDALTPNKASVAVTCVPSGATQISAAESTAGGSGGTTKYGKVIAAKVGTTFTPSTAGYPWAGMIAKNSSGGSVGGWAVRLQTVPGGEPPKETRRQELEAQLTAAKGTATKRGEELSRAEAAVVEAEEREATATNAYIESNSLVQKIEGELNELPPEESQAEREAREAKEREAKEQTEREAKEREAKERAEREQAEREAREQKEREAREAEELEKGPFGAFHKGVDGGGWGQTNELTDYAKLGQSVSVRLENPGNTSYLTSRGYYVVYLLNHYSTSGVKAVNKTTYANEAASVHATNPSDAIEVLNEPAGNWFWGGSAGSEAEARAYTELLKEVHAKIPGAIIYASADGGHAGDDSWLKKLLKVDPNVIHYVTAWTNHPYDGSGASPEATLVHFGSVEETHRLTGEPVDITEYGRPLAASTGDSPRSTEAQQAKADGAMVAKSRSVGWVLGVEIYGYRGDGSPNYAIFKGDGTPRPAVAAVAKA